MASDFKKVCGEIGGNYSERKGDALCSVTENQFRQLQNKPKMEGININDSSLTSGGRMNIENIEKVEKLINYNYYIDSDSEFDET